jgi:hypothetical protein
LQQNNIKRYEKGLEWVETTVNRVDEEHYSAIAEVLMAD